MLKNLVEATWLKRHLNANETIIIDCRNNLFDPFYGEREYNKCHIVNSFFFKMDKDIAGIKKEHGGYRPLPDENDFIRKLETIGVNSEKTIIIYDDNLNAAPRLWYQLKLLNHQNCFILNGGFQNWLVQNYPVSKEQPPLKTEATYIAKKIDKSIFCDINYVKEVMNNPGIILVDSREYERYSGQKEPLYQKAGHLPGAINIPWSKCRDKGFLKNYDELNNIFKKLFDYEEIIFYCGSGIAACGNFLALNELGIRSKVYIGSFTDWISYKNNMIETCQ